MLANSLPPTYFGITECIFINGRMVMFYRIHPPVRAPLLLFSPRLFHGQNYPPVLGQLGTGLQQKKNDLCVEHILIKVTARALSWLSRR